MYKPIEKAIYKGPDYKEPESPLKKDLTQISATLSGYIKSKLPLVKKIVAIFVLILILIISITILFKFADQKKPQQQPPQITIASPQVQTEIDQELQKVQTSLDKYDQQVDNMTKTTVKNFPPPKVDLNVIF